MEVDYDDRNRAFLQAFMARSTMTFEEAQPVLAAILSAHRTHISPFSLQLFLKSITNPRYPQKEAPSTRSTSPKKT
jgi:hypothetical protein